MNRTISLVILCIILFSLTGCTVGGIDVEQESATGLAGELLDGHSFGQTFITQYDGLYRLDLYTATYDRENTHPVVFRICSSPTCQAGEELQRLELPAAQISNSGPTVITFPTITGTAGHTIYFSVESPGSVPGDAISVYRNDTDVYPDGQMFIDGQPTNGDIAFIAYTHETFTTAEIWNDFYSRASQDKPFFIFYCLLLGLVLVALIAVLAWRPKPPVPPSGDDIQPPRDNSGVNLE
jgi:hypothetical protein